MKVDLWKNPYIQLFIVAVLSLLVGAFCGYHGVIGIVALTPGMASLIGAAWLIIDKELAHRRALELQSKGQAFDLGVASHMAQIAFDKHVVFCQEYAIAAHDGLVKLFQIGPTAEVIEIWKSLYTTRLKHIPWVPLEVTQKLEAFEGSIRKVASNATLVRTLQTEFTSNNQERYRQDLADKMITAYEEALGITATSSDSNQLKGIDGIIELLQSILGIPSLTKLRQKAIERALASSI